MEYLGNISLNQYRIIFQGKSYKSKSNFSLKVKKKGYLSLNKYIKQCVTLLKLTY